MKGQRRWTDVIDGGRAHLDDAVEGGHEADFDHLLLRRQSRHARAVGAHVVTLSVILDQREHTADIPHTLGNGEVIGKQACTCMFVNIDSKQLTEKCG